MALITQMSTTSELTLVKLKTRTLGLNFVDIFGIRVELFGDIPNIYNENAHVNRGNTSRDAHLNELSQEGAHQVISYLNELSIEGAHQVIYHLNELSIEEAYQVISHLN